MFSLYFIHSSEPGAGDCCYKKTVSGSKDGLDGEFVFVRTQDLGPEDSICVDHCVYERWGDLFPLFCHAPTNVFRTGDPGKEYCFKSVTEAPDVIEECKAEAEITKGTCPLKKEDVDHGIAGQRNITQEEEESNMRSMLQREYRNNNKRLVLTNPSRHWPNNEIPYLLRWSPPQI